MKVSYFTIGYKVLFESLSRYSEFIYNNKIGKYSLYEDGKYNSNECIMIYETEKYNTNILNTIKNCNVAVCGINSDSFIDLKNIEKSINIINEIKGDCCSDFPPVFSKNEIGDHLEFFLNSHGSISLVSDLSFILYALNNYDLLQSAYLKYTEYEQSYYNPSKNKWRNFSSKYKEFNTFIRFIGLNEEAFRIDKLIIVINPIFEGNLHSINCFPEKEINCLDLLIEELYRIAEKTGIDKS